MTTNSSQAEYPAFKVRRYSSCAHYYLFASPTNCVEFAEVRGAGIEFGFSINSLRSRPVVKKRYELSKHMDRDLWHAEVKASMLAHLDCAMDLVKICEGLRVVNSSPTLTTYKDAYSEARSSFDLTKRRFTRNNLIESGVAVDHAQAQLLLD